MGAALLGKEEYNVLISAELLNNAALISSHMVDLTSLTSFFIQLQDLHLETAEEIACCVYHFFRAMPLPLWLCGKEHCPAVGP